jgi:hypothetical protein
MNPESVSSNRQFPCCWRSESRPDFRAIELGGREIPESLNERTIALPRKCANLFGCGPVPSCTEAEDGEGVDRVPEVDRRA